MESHQNIVFYIFYIFEVAVAWLSLSAKIVLDVAIEGYDHITKKFKFSLHWQD